MKNSTESFDRHMRPDPRDEGGKKDVSIESMDLGRLLHELRVHQAELEMQNEQLRAAELELVASRDRYQALYEQAPVGYVTLDATGRILNANITLCQRIGRERRWLIGCPLSSLMSESDADVFHLHLRAVLGGAHATCEVGLQHLSGTTSAPFETGEQRQIAVKVIDERGNELLVVRGLV